MILGRDICMSRMADCQVEPEIVRKRHPEQDEYTFEPWAPPERYSAAIHSGR